MDGEWEDLKGQSGWCFQSVCGGMDVGQQNCRALPGLEHWARTFISQPASDPPSPLPSCLLPLAIYPCGLWQAKRHHISFRQGVLIACHRLNAYVSLLHTVCWSLLDTASPSVATTLLIPSWQPFFLFSFLQKMSCLTFVGSHLTAACGVLFYLFSRNCSWILREAL